MTLQGAMANVQGCDEDLKRYTIESSLLAGSGHSSGSTVSRNLPPSTAHELFIVHIDSAVKWRLHQFLVERIRPAEPTADVFRRALVATAVQLPNRAHPRETRHRALRPFAIVEPRRI